MALPKYKLWPCGNYSPNGPNSDEIPETTGVDCGPNDPNHIIDYGPYHQNDTTEVNAEQNNDEEAEGIQYNGRSENSENEDSYTDDITRVDDYTDDITGVDECTEQGNKEATHDAKVIAEMNATNREVDSATMEEEHEGNSVAKDTATAHRYNLCPRPTKAQDQLNLLQVD